MHGEDVASFVAQAREVLAATPDMGKRNTELRLVEPLLSMLGWDVRSPAVTAAYSASNGTVVDYALCPDGAVGAFVATAPAADGLSSSRRDEVLAAMRTADVPRGAYTNGREFVLLALTADETERVELSLEELPERTDALAALSYDAVASVTEGGGDAVADALVAAEGDAVEAVTEAVLEVARDHGSEDVDGVGADVRPLARRFLDAVVNDLAGDDVGGGVSESPGRVATATPGGDSVRQDSNNDISSDASDDTSPDASDDTSPDASDDTSPDASDDTSRDASDDDAPPESGGDVPGGRDDEETAGNGRGTERLAGVRSLSAASASGQESSDGEFVLRFFEDGRSVGAVGSSNVPAAAAQGVQYLLDERGIGPRIQFPYAPGNDERAFLHREPVHPDGSRMTDAIDLGGLYVHIGSEVDALQAALETLAERGGLRVMFSGDWS